MSTPTPRYRYFVVNIIDNRPLAEIPFQGVSYNRALKGAGSFGGNIAITAETDHLNLYETTMPGRTAIYVMRNNEVVWGGIIWSRSYNVNQRVLNISASEFTSYFYHRRIWKTWGQEFSATVISSGGVLTGTLDLGSTYGIEVGSTIRLIFYTVENFQYNGFYEILTYDPDTFTFTTNNSPISGGVFVPNGEYFFTTVYLRTNTYDYVRSLLNAVAQDFTGIKFANDEIEPAKKFTHNVISREISNGIAELTFDQAHKLVPGQQIELKNVHPLLDGLRTATEATGNTVTINNYGGTLTLANVSTQLYRLTSRQVFGNVVTVTTNVAHSLFAGQSVTIRGLDPANSPVSRLDGTFTIGSILNTTAFTYTISTSLTLLPLTLTAPTAAVTGKTTEFLIRQEIQTVNSFSFATLTTGFEHEFEVGDSVTITDLRSFATIINRSLINNVITYTTQGNHPFVTTDVVTVSGLADVTNVAARGLSINTSTNVVTFTVGTVAPHNLQIGNTVTISGGKDVYGISQYSYSTDTNTLVLTFNTNHNIELETGQSVTIKNLGGTLVNIANMTSNSVVVNVNTSAPHGLQNNDPIIISGANVSTSLAINLLSRTSNVATARTSSAHGFTNGDIVTIVANGSTPSNYSATNVAVTVVNTTAFKYPSTGADSTTTGSTTVTLNHQETITWKNGVKITSNNANLIDYTNTLYNGVTSTLSNALPRRSAARYTTFSPSGNNINVTSLKLTLTRRNDVNSGNDGAQLVIGVHSDTDLSNNSDAPGTISGTSTFTVTNWDRGETKTVDLPSAWRPYFANSLARGIRTGFSTAPATFVELGNYDGPSSRITVGYTFTTGANISGANIATVTRTAPNLNGNFTAEGVANSTFFRYRTNTSVFAVTNTPNATVAPASAPFNRTYESTALLSRTANTLSINVPGVTRNYVDIVVPVSTPLTNTSAVAEIDSVFNGTYNVTATPTATQIQYQRNTNVSDVITLNLTYGSESTSVPVLGSAIVFSADLNRTNATITATTPNTFSIAYTSARTIPAASENISPTGVASVPSTADGGPRTITAVTADTFTVNLGSIVATVNSSSIYGFATSLTESTVTYGTYGPYALSSDIELGFSTNAYSNTDVVPPFFRGFEVRNVGEELDTYSDIINGFDYRIDCSINEQSGEFERTFVLIPIIPGPVREYIENQPGGVLPTGEAVPLEYYGADRIIFEFPGNIADLQLEESAENASTRFFMVGNIGDLGDDASQPYAAATANNLLNPAGNASKWPLLDDDEAAEDIEDEEKLYQYAERYLIEAKPPLGRFTVQVNGSVQPIVGTYAPGDWCSLIINDKFVSQRLQSDLEPRDNVLLRKINGFSVNVPDSITYPEEITLDLIAEWEVDKVGE